MEFFEYPADKSFNLDHLAGQVVDLAFELRGLKLALAYSQLRSRKTIFKRVGFFLCALAGKRHARDQVRETALRVVDVCLPLGAQRGDDRGERVLLQLIESRRLISRSGDRPCVSAVVLADERFAYGSLVCGLALGHPFVMLGPELIVLGEKRGKLAAVGWRFPAHQVAPVKYCACPVARIAHDA